MNELEIRELFIRGALIDSRLPHAARPARLKSQSLPFMHTIEDKAGWEAADFILGEVRKDSRGVELQQRIREMIKKNAKDQLPYGDRGRLDLEAANFWDGDRITPEQVSEWERCNELMRLVSRVRNRRCLWAYAQAQAKVLAIPHQAAVKINEQPTHNGRRYPWLASETVMKRVSFSKWCRDVEDIHRNYGKTCADHAIAEITFKLSSKVLQHNEKCEISTLQDRAQIRDIVARLDEPTIGHDAFTEDGWVVKDKRAARLRFDERLMHIDLSEVRKRDRRAREKRKAA